MFMRFSNTERGVVSHHMSHHMVGVFHAARELIDSGRLPAYEIDYLEDLIGWFGLHLRRPRRFTTRGFSEGRAICWFRTSATPYISRAWEMATILQRHDMRIYHDFTVRPGYIAYEDEFQVAAIPYRDTWD